MITILEILKKLLDKKYEIKDLGDVKTIIGWQIIRDLVVRTMKTDKSIFIRDFGIKKGLTNWNTNIIPMKIGLAIEITDPEDYKETKLWEYQYLINKLMYLVYRIWLNIIFGMGQLSE